jgi:putative addiction module killer protein
MSYQVRELILPDGTSPYAAWFTTLDPVAAAKISVATTRMEQGNLSNVEWFRGIGEYKVDWGPGYRIYLAKDGLRIIVLLVAAAKSASKRISLRRLPYGKTTSGSRPKRKKERDPWH